MKVFILIDNYNNNQELDSLITGDRILGVYDTYDKAKQAAMDYELDSLITGDRILGVYDTYDKAKQAAMDYEPHDFNIAEDQERQVTELVVPVHMNEGVVRDVREYIDEYHMYDHELYITEMEVQ